MDKSLVSALPKTRPYTLIEAAFSYQIDLNNNVRKSYREYERIWGWSLKKVMNFINNGQGTKTEQSRNTREIVKFRFIKELQYSKNQAGIKQNVTQAGYKQESTGGQAGIKQEPEDFLNFQGLQYSKNQAGSEQESTGGQAGNTTIKINNKKRIYAETPQEKKRDPRVKELIGYFQALCKEELDQMPTIEGSKDGPALKRALSAMDIERIKFIFQWYIKSEKARSEYGGLKISVALSNDSITKYQKTAQWQYEG